MDRLASLEALAIRIDSSVGFRDSEGQTESVELAEDTPLDSSCEDIPTEGNSNAAQYVIKPQ